MLFAYIQILLFLVYVRTSAFAQSNWEVISSQPPPRSKQVQVPIDSERLFIFGGRNGGGVPLNDAWVLNVTSNVFSSVVMAGDVPAPRFSSGYASLTKSDGISYVYIFSGSNSQDIFYDMFEVRTTNWLSKAVTKPPIRGRWRMASFSLANRYLLLGFGIAETAMSDLYQYDAWTDTWAEIVPRNSDDKPTPRFDPCCTAINTTAFVCFGGTTFTTEDSNEVFVFDTQYNYWSRLFATSRDNASPFPRRVAACTYLPNTNELLVSNGWSSELVREFNDVWTFNLGSKTWQNQPLTITKTELYSMDSSVWTTFPNKNSSFMFGGWGAQTINTLYMIDSNTKLITTLAPNQIKPTARSLHCVVAWGTNLTVLLG
eukprot:PhF_6_TR37506/c0_g1_i2/m.55396